jgi:hypothetical protein
MLGVEAGREALEKRAPVQYAPGMRKTGDSESTAYLRQLKLKDGGPGPLTPCLCR